MTQPRNVIYLPPGVVPAQSTPPHPVGEHSPFDRQFFETLLPQAIASFCKQAGCDSPRVEVYTTDGAMHYVNGISGVADDWVALYASRDEHPRALELFLPYQVIYRVEIHPESDESRRHLGFVAPLEAQVPPPIQGRAAAKADAPAAAAGSGRSRKGARRPEGKR